MARPLVCIDLGSKYIKGAVLKSKSNGDKDILLSKFGSVEMPEKAMVNVFSDKPITKAKEVQQKMSELVSKLGVRGYDAFLLIPDYLVVINWLNMPVKAKDAIDKSIPTTLSPLLPLELDKWFYDYQIAENSKKQTMVVAQAILKANLFDLGDLMSGAGLNAVGIDSSFFNLINLMHPYYSDEEVAKKNVAVVYLGNEATTIAFLKEGVIKSSRSIPIGGGAFTRHIMEAKRIDETAAEKIKKEEEIFLKENPDKQNKVELYNIIKPSFGELVKGIYNSIDQYLARFREFKIHEIILCGGTSSFRNISGAMQLHLNTKTVMLSEIIKIDTGTKQVMTDDDRNILQCAVGGLLRN
ncbi:MAG TPA: pilus assembly protein PilM [Candidatus Wallbacteria bacterium]|nr:pilus assembly protein PilM [Candidatus Wallbacteria bacterium]